MMMWLLRQMSRWPLPLLQAIGAAIGWLSWALSPPYRRRLRTNARRAGLDESQQRAAVLEAGRAAGELPWLWLMPHEGRLGDRVDWSDAAALDAALQQPGGLLLLTPHMGSFEVAARAIAEGYGSRKPLTVLYRPSRDARLRHFQELARARPGLATAPANLSGVRQMLRALRAGEAVGLLPDQVPPSGQGAWAPFFGRDAYTMTLAGRLLQQTDARPVILWCERLPRGRFALHATAPSRPLAQPEMSDTGAAAQHAAAALNQCLEEVILRSPTQYLWGYHRYKTPRGQPRSRDD